MGLGISQVRLLALTHRKSDIELEMSIDSKRKQQLTRKASELSQTYYSRLNNYNYQYATKGGYNDLDYDYLMGESDLTGNYTNDFKKQIITGSNEIPYKTDSNIVLTNNVGEVILNNELASCCLAAQLYCPQTSTENVTLDQTAYAAWSFITSNANMQEYNSLSNDLSDSCISGGSGLRDTEIIELIKQLIELGGVTNGGEIFVYNRAYQANPESERYNYRGSNGYYSESDANIRQLYKDLSDETFYSDLDLNNQTFLQAGHCYTVSAVENDSNGTMHKFATNANQCYYDGNKFIPLLRLETVQKLYNVIRALAPSIAAALQNGYTTDLTLDEQDQVDLRNTTDTGKAQQNSAIYNYTLSYYKWLYGTELQNNSYADVQIRLLNGAIMKLCVVKDTHGVTTCEETNDPYTYAAAHGIDVNNRIAKYTCIPPSWVDAYVNEHNLIPQCSFGKVKYKTYEYNGTSPTVQEVTRKYANVNGVAFNISSAQYNDLASGTNELNTSEFMNVQDTELLQDGLKSGAYQICLVENLATGSLKRNTTMDYFVHRNLCIEKVDNSKREELTAWYNAEQAAISEKETYWDEEISNLSTELTSINTEIESVKTLKTNAIKSVFNWGGQ